MAKGNHERGKGLAIGAAIGAVAGVVTGILFAPKSGKETRQDIKDTAVKAKHWFDEESRKVQEELSNVIGKVEKLAKEKGSEYSARAKSALESARQAKDNLTAKAEEIRQGKNTADKDLRTALKKAEEAQAALQKFLKK